MALKDVGIERLVLESDFLTVEILPALGGKIASLRRDGVELLQQPLRPYAPRNLKMGFEESDASGFDECLPSVSGCEIAGPWGAIRIPDHGEFWRLPCQAEQRGSSELRLTASGSVLPLRFERTLKLEGDALNVDYRLENVSEAEIPYVWSAHPLFAVDEGDGIVLPESVVQVSVEGSAHGRLGAKGTVHRWPVAELRDGAKVNLSIGGEMGEETGDKLYTSAPAEGWTAIERRRVGLRVEVRFDAAVTPWLGLWLCYGGWPQEQASRQQCIAIEPCTAPADSLAEALEKRWARMLAPGQTAFWRMVILVSQVS
jgi:galactose mutarotase-like enzyme